MSIKEKKIKEKEPKIKKPRRKGRIKKVIKWIIVILVLAGLAVAGVHYFLGGNEAPVTDTQYKTEKAEKRTIISSLSGSGALQPADSYTVTTLMQGEIISADFEEGNIVEKDTVLYQIDSSDVSNKIEKSQIELNQAQRNYDDALRRQYIKSTISGRVVEFLVETGDRVVAGTPVATIRDSSIMNLTVPFPSDDALKFTVGQPAVITLDNTFETLNGTVKSISATDTVAEGNMIVRNVEIFVSNPGGLGVSQAATASIGGVNCAAPGSFQYNTEGTVVASNSGKVVSFSVKEGDYVTKDQVLIMLGGEDIENAIKAAADNIKIAQLNGSDAVNQLDNYTLKSPIKGTIVDKQYKAGDNIEAGYTLCTIYDMSYLEMNMGIDELDISKIQVGQSVQITADAVEGKSYTGVITKVSVVSESTTAGATAYPVTVRIDEYEGLRPGMNVDAEIVLAKAENVISVPNEAVNRGNVILITKDSPSAKNKIKREAPEGYVYVQVETGVSDDDYIEIKSGITEKDKIAYVMVQAQSNGMMFPMGGGMRQGGMSGGFGNGNMTSGGSTPTGGNMPSGGGMPSGGMGGMGR